MGNDKIYHDEPIIYHPARFTEKDGQLTGVLYQKNRPDRSDRPDDHFYTPEKIIEMRHLAYRTEALGKPREWLFLQQARLMEWYEDFYTQPVTFNLYYPTYAAMTNAQLRTYFTWRASVRLGIYPDVCLSFLYVYLYELIAGIGCKDADDGLQKLRAVQEHYTDTFPKLRTNLETWMRDYVLYYGLDPEILRGSEEEKAEEAVALLLHEEDQTDDALFAALQALSSYKIERSAYFKSHRDDYIRAACRTYRMMAAHYREHGNLSFCEQCFGRMTEMRFSIFRNAVFYPEKRAADRKITINEIHTYSVRNGIWYCKRYYGKLQQNQQLGTLLRAVDAAMRERTGFKTLTPPEMTKLLAGIVRKALDACEAEKQAQERQAVTIDLSRLSGIRAASDVTRDKLLVEEDAAISQPEPEPAQTAPEPAPDQPLSPHEYRFLQALLYGGDWRQTAKECGALPSVLADAVNEKLFDLFGDTVIDDAGDIPVLIEDYTDELKGMIQP